MANSEAGNTFCVLCRPLYTDADTSSLIKQLRSFINSSAVQAPPGPAVNGVTAHPPFFNQSPMLPYQLRCLLPASVGPPTLGVWSLSHRTTREVPVAERLINFFWRGGLHHEPCRILVLHPGIEPAPPAVEEWILYHWTTREVLRLMNLKKKDGESLLLAKMQIQNLLNIVA